PCRARGHVPGRRALRHDHGRGAHAGPPGPDRLPRGREGRGFHRPLRRPAQRAHARGADLGRGREGLRPRRPCRPRLRRRRTQGLATHRQLPPPRHGGARMIRRTPFSAVTMAAVRPLAAAGIAVAFALAAIPSRAAAQVAVRAETLYTMAGPAINDGVVLIGRDGKIERVGPASQVRIPDGYRVLTAKVATPGLVDAHTVVGLSGYLNQPHEQDHLDRTNAIQPELRAFDAYNAEEALVRWLREHGVTTIHTGHGPGALMSGQTMVVKTRGRTVEEALVDSVTMVAMTLGPEVSANYNGRPGTRAKGMALVRAEFIKARDYAKRRKAADESRQPARDLKLEILARVLDGEIPALITAQRATEILAALRLQKEF